jgi:ATP synthase protein I
MSERDPRASAALGTAALAVGGVVVAALTSGAAGAWGVLVGTVMIVVLFSAGTGVIRAAATLSPALSLLVALLTYVLQLVLLVAVLIALERSTLLGESLDRAWIGGTIIVGTLVWSAALVSVDLRRPHHHPRREGEGEPAHGAVPGGEPSGGPPR